MRNNLFDFLRMGRTVNTPPIRHRMRSVLLVLGLLLGSLNVWGDNAAVDDVLWGETWTGATTATSGSSTAKASANCSTTKGTTMWGGATITYSESANTVYVRNDALAKGKAPELMFTSGQTWTISDIPTGNAAEMTLTFKNNNNKVSVTCTTADVTCDGSITGESTSGYVGTFKIDNSTAKASTITLKFSNSGNTRLDDIQLVVKTAAATGCDKTEITDELAWSGASASVTYGEEPYSLPSLTNTIPVSVSYQSTDETVATISNTGVVSILKAGTTTIKAVFAGDETYNAKTVQYTLTVNKAAPTPIVGGMVDQLSISTFGVTGGYTAFTNKSASNSGHSPAVYAGTVARNGNSTKYNIQLNSGQTSNKLREIATSTSGGLARRVYVTWATQSTNTANKKLTVYGSNTAYTGKETASTGTNIGDIVYAEGDTYEYLDIADDYKYIQIVADGAIYMDQIDVTWVPVPTYAVNLSNTGCTLNVQKGSTPVADNDKFEKGTELTISYSASEGYENASLKVKKTSDMSDVTKSVLSGSTLTMPAYDITIEATATKKQYTVTLAATNGKIQVGGVDKTEIVVTHGETAELTAVANDGYAFNGWSKDGEGIGLGSESDNPMTITVTGAGTVTASFRSTAKADPEISWSAVSAEVVKGQVLSLPSINNPHGLTLAYSSTNEGVAQIDGEGNVTINGVGTTTIKAIFTENDDYAGDEKSYTLTVKGRVTWHIIKEGTDATSSADYAKGAVPTKPVDVTSCDASISLVGWTTGTYPKSDVAPATLYTEDVPAVTDNADYYAVWGVVEEGGWNEVTTVAGLTAGTYAICSDHYFMKAVKVDSKNRLQNGGEPSISEGKLTSAPTADCQWTISINGDGKYLFQNGDKYAIATSTKNEMSLSSAADIAEDAHAQWEIARSGSIFEVTNIGRAGDSNTPANKYLRNNTTNGWACYSSNQGGEGYAPRFFKYSAGSAKGYTTNCVGPVEVATPTFSPDGSAAYYTEAQNVTINCATEGSIIYYTLDNTTPSKTNGTQYTAAINVEETKTIKAIAYVGDDASEVAEATFTINLPLTTIQEIFDEATAIGSSAAQERVITFNSWVVSAIGFDEKSVYVTDGEKGFVIYGSDHGFVVGDILSGTVTCNLQLFGGFAEIKGMKYNAQGLNVTTGGTLYPHEVSLKNLGAINTGAPIVINNVTCDSDGDLVDAESYYATPVEWFYPFETSTFETNKIYKVTGIYIYGSNSDKIVPRDADDIVKLTKEQPTLTWKINDTPIGESYSIDNKDVPFAPVCVANSTGSKSYESSNTSIATIDEDGVLTVIGNGVTTITCTVAEDDDYVEGSKSFTLKVGVYDATWVASTWATAESVDGNTKMADKSPIAIDANLSMTWSKAEGSNDPIYHSDGEGRLYQKNTVTITASNSKQITRIEFHFTGTNTGTISANEGTYSAGVWTGFAPSVTFTNAPGASGAKIKSIDIEYAQGVTTTLVIEDMIILDNASATDIVFSSNKPGAVVTYSDYDEGVINIADGKITPVEIGKTTVKASIAAEAPYSSVSITFNVRVKSRSETVETVVILSQFGDKLLAMKHDFTAVEVEKAADGTILDLTCDEEDITWIMTADGASAMFQQSSTNKYLAVGSSNALTLVDEATTWTLHEDGYYYNVSGRTFLYQGDGAKYKNYSTSNAGTSAAGGYSGYATFVAPIFANREELRGGLTEGKWGTYCPDHDVKYPAGASFYTLTYKEVVAGQPYKVFFDEVEPGAALVGGKPYLFIAEGEAIKGVKVGDAASLQNYNGFTGVLSNFTLTVTSEESAAYTYYIVYGNEIRLCGAGQFYVPAERAYLDMSQMSSTPVAPAPGRRRISLVNHAAETATGMENVQGDNVQCTKVLIDGELFILRGEKMYDAKGQLVK